MSFKVISIIESAVHVFVLFESDFKQIFIYTNTCYHFYKINAQTVEYMYIITLYVPCVLSIPLTLN